MKKPQPDPSVMENPYRPYSIGVKICILGVIGFSLCSFLLLHESMDSRFAPIVHIKGYPLTPTALVVCAQLFFLLIMTCILIVLHRRGGRRCMELAEELSGRLTQELKKQKMREAQSEKTIRDLERFNAMAMGREERILELKHEVNTLMQEQGRPMRYTAAPTE